MNKARLKLEALAVESFAIGGVAYTDVVRAGGGCVCDMAPCICTKGPDCTDPTATQ